MASKGLLVTIKNLNVYKEFKFWFRTTRDAYNYGLRASNYINGAMQKGCYIQPLTTEDKNKFPNIDDLPEDFKSFLLDLSRDKQKAWLNGVNGVKDLLSDDEYSVYNQLDYPFNVFILEDALTRKLKVDPDYEVWVPLKYYKKLTHRKNDSPNFFETDKILISNKGRIVTLEQGFDISRGSFKHDYLTSTTHNENVEKLYFTIHRAVACCFITIKPPHSGKGMASLEVNHKDGIKINNDFSNLEWVTTSENIFHAIKNDLKIYTKGSGHHASTTLLGEVMIPGKYKGTKFIISGEEDRLKYKLQCAVKVANGKANITKGCTFRKATEEDLQTFDYIDKLPEELLELITNFRSTGGVNNKLLI